MPASGRAREVRACVIVIGNEVLSGRTRDANIQMLGAGLAEVGVRLTEARVIADDVPVIVDTVNEMRARFDYVFTTGGIGPTHDDLTAQAIAAAFGTTLERNAEAVARLQSHYGTGDLNAARLKMADIPRGATLIDNPVSQAPGFRIGNVFVLAGVPRIAQAMFDGVRHGLAGGPPVVSRATAAYLREGDLAEPLAAIQAGFTDVDLGSYPFVRGGRLGVSIVGRGTAPARVAAAIAAVEDAMRALGTEPDADDPVGGNGEIL
ncbi:competence/damage-inducible protein A [Novispirillum sp. DQ9]|uniref:competence/damage-inducible protein A n=1 Tax=Novispirillum sp. DQ9 TaxID=3398612 RepID=UPI003C79C2CC